MTTLERFQATQRLEAELAHERMNWIDDGATPKRYRPMPNRDEFSRAHNISHRDPDGGPVTQTYRS